MALPVPYQLKTFADITNAVREELKIQSTDTVSISRIQRDINIIYLDEVVSFSNWRWLRGNINLGVAAAFSNGTASVTQNSSQVTLTTTPGPSRKNFYFSVVGYNEIYRIQAHTSSSVTVYLESGYTGATNATASYKIWTDEVPLPSFVRESLTVYQDFQDNPLENCGLQKYRQYVAALPKAEGRPLFYTCETYTDPGQYTAVTSLPALSTRASDILNKTLVFVADVSSYLAQGDRIKITLAGDATYNGEYVVASVSTTTITYTGIYPLTESATADSSMAFAKAYSSSNDRRYKRLLIYPSINASTQMLHCDYLREVVPMVNDADEPLMPIGDRAVLLYGALQRAWSRERNPEEATKNQGLYDRKLARMAGKVDDSIEPPKLTINRVYLGSKRMAQRQRSVNEGFFPGGNMGGGSSGGGNTGTPNRVAVFDSSGNLLASVTTSTEEVYVHGVTSQLAGNSDVATYTNKSISATTNTLTNIANAEIKALAAIAVNKLAALSASLVVVSDASGFLTTSTVTSAQLSTFFSGLTLLTTVSLSDNQSSAANVFTYVAATYPKAIIDYSIDRGSSNIELGRLMVVTDASASVNITQTTSALGASGVTLTADYNSSNVRIRYTSTSTGTAPTFKYIARQWA